MKPFRLLSAAIALVLGGAGLAPAGVVVETNILGYSGTWTAYGTLNDAINGTNPTGSGVTPQRDLTVGAYRGIAAGPNAGPDYAAIVTRWSDPAVGNPNNTNLGFLQYVNTSNPNSGITAAWLDNARTSFGVSITGPASTPSGNGDQQRFGATGADAGIGDFLSFQLLAAFNGVTPNPGTDANGDFTGTGFTGVSGYIRGIIQEGSTFYSFNLSLNGIVTAPPGTPYANFASNQINPNFIVENTLGIPEPATLAVVGLFSLAGVAVRARRKRAVTA